MHTYIYIRSVHDCIGVLLMDATNKHLIGGRYVYSDFSMGHGVLGEGLSGPVRLVKSRKTGKQYALKTISVPQGISEGTSARVAGASFLSLSCLVGFLTVA